MLEFRSIDLNSELKVINNLLRRTVREDIAIRFEPAGDGAALRVADSGYGIPAHHLPRITERFYRVSTSRSRESGGTGLGLAIAKHVLGLHGAQLAIDSEVGVGSTFSCLFPRERCRQRSAALPSA